MTHPGIAGRSGRSARQLFVSDSGPVVSDGLLSYYTFNDGTATDTIGNNDGTVNGATHVADGGPQDDGAFSFDGTDDAIDIPNFPSFSAFTISAWAKNNTPNDGDEDYVIVLTHNNRIYFRGSGDGDMEMEVYDGSNQHDIFYPITADAWEHWVMAWDGSTLRGYKNGNEFESTSASNSSGVGNNADAIGGDFNSSRRYFDGIIDDVRVYDRALSQSEVQEIYDAEKP